jgi:hypothetical protein
MYIYIYGVYILLHGRYRMFLHMRVCIYVIQCIYIHMCIYSYLCVYIYIYIYIDINVLQGGRDRSGVQNDQGA